MHVDLPHLRELRLGPGLRPTLGVRGRNRARLRSR